MPTTMEITMFEDEEVTEEEIVVDDETQVEEDSVEETAEEEVEKTEDETLTVSIGDEEADEEEEVTPVFKDLRKRYKTANKRVKELEAELQGNEQAKEQLVLGPKPALADFDYEEDKYEPALLTWHNKKRAIDDENKAKEKEAQTATEAWQSRLTNYDTQKTDLQVPDFEEYEDDVRSALSVTQQSIIISGTDKPALVILALGKNKKVLDELASITDPVKFAVKLGRIEAQMKVGKTKKIPSPEKILKSNGNKSGAANQTLDRLRADAAKSGDYTLVMAHKRSLKVG